MKPYLSAKELNDILFTFHLLEQNTKTVNEWQGHNNITTTDAGNLRRAIAYTNKFLESVIERLPIKEQKKVQKRITKAMKEPIRIVDSWMEQRIFGTYDTEFEIVKIERPSFEKLCMACIQAHCTDCQSSYANCDIYDLFEDNLMPRAELKPNCPYAFDSENTIREREEKAKARLEAKGNISKRKAKKLKNKYDEDDTVIEYNFEARGDNR